VQAFGDLATDKSNRRGQAFERLLGFFIVPFYVEEDSSRPGIIRQGNAIYARQTDTGVAELALENGFNLLTKSLAQALTVIFLVATFHPYTSSVKRMRISEK
jgi:hypothetical protein